ncbi:S-layer homology domain-containing protein [Paenibacillus daejeonensis]|uniref:S-layer homology domain-containing protein n=1 Tax=Paenibacillus daejeonensis TaxID=135193 RepID=UPI0012F8875B|nr:S-layer homology domain-containing protein [Paenibacillus daejeonensis]
MKHLIAAILVIAMLISPAAAFAAPDMSLQVSAAQVQRGSEVTLSGTIPSATGEVVIKVVRPDSTVLFLDVALAAEGRYSSVLAIPARAELAPSGMYTAVAGYGSEQASVKFSVVSAPDGPGPGPGPGPGTPPTVPPVNEEEEEQEQEPGPDNGDVTGATVKPAQNATGVYTVTPEALAQAISQSSGTVTIELPSAATNAVQVELSAASWRELASSRQSLVLQAGGLMMRFPAGAMPTSNGSEEQIRITLNTAWDGAARAAVEQAAGTDYKPTGVVLSVVIERISGGARSVVSAMNHPVTIVLELNAEQRRQLQAELAGIYYVNGQQLDYIKADLTGGKASFVTDHFSTYALLEYNKQFSDMNGHWANSAVRALAAKGIITGVDADHYRPSVSITRADFVTLIMRAMTWENETIAQSGEHGFQDVPAGRYYTEHVAAAESLGIVNGYNGMFRPQDQITREEAAAALVRASEHFDVSTVIGGSMPFTDRAEIAAWATPLVEQAWSMGLIEGDGGAFMPKQSLTRAQVAVMIERLLTNG